MVPPQISWDDVLRRLDAQLSSSAIDVWLRPLVPQIERSDDLKQTRLRLLCPTGFHRDRVRERFLPYIAACAGSDLAGELSVQLEVSPDGEASTAAAPVSQLRTAAAKPVASATRGDPEGARRLRRVEPSRPRGSRPIPRGLQQGFDNFVVGPCNALAREACLALVRDASPSLNPLYLASASGLGKTHLARSVVREAARQEAARVVYATAEGFTNEFMAAIRSRDTFAFKRRFRNGCDVLVVEDVGFLDGKTQTQLELFHSIQHVLDAGGRVLATGDRLPRFMTSLDQRMRSQLSSGLVAELQMPSAKVRRAILRAKAAAGGVRLPADCLDLLVEEVRGSVQELEGSLIQVVSTASLLKRPIDLALTRDAIAKKCGTARLELRRPDPDAVIEVVTTFFKTTPQALASRSRRRNVLVPRQLAMYLCRRYTNASLAEIGRAMGRDHPAVKNAVARVEREILERAPVRYQVEALCERLDELTGARAPQPRD